MRVDYRKNDNKPQLARLLAAPKALEEMARVLEFGATKYPSDNWRKNLPIESAINSLLRHVLAHANGEEIDTESGRPHLAHAAVNALMALEIFCTMQDNESN